MSNALTKLGLKPFHNAGRPSVLDVVTKQCHNLKQIIVLIQHESHKLSSSITRDIDVVAEILSPEAVFYLNLKGTQ